MQLSSPFVEDAYQHVVAEQESNGNFIFNFAVARSFMCVCYLSEHLGSVWINDLSAAYGLSAYYDKCLHIS